MAKKETKKSDSASIPALLKQLEASTDQLEKRKIRAKLRKLGHTGGANAQKGAKSKKDKGKDKDKGSKKKVVKRKGDSAEE